MARIRTTKPEFWTRPDVLECSPLAPTLYKGMENFCDDFGNIEGSHKTIKALVFPAHDIDIDPLINELLQHEMLIQYIVNGRNYYHLRTFLEDQKIDKRGQPRCPEYKEYSTSPADHSTTPPESPPLPPTPTDVREGKGGEGSGKELKQNPLFYEVEILPSLKPSDLIDQNLAFEIAWKAYPVPNGKKAAKRHFKDTVKTKADWIRQIKAFNYYGDYVVAQNKNGGKRRWQDGSTFFNNWEEWAEKADKEEMTR